MMSNKVAKQKPKTVAKASEAKFYLYELREHSRDLFGVKPEILDGAFLNVRESQISKAEAKKYIDSFLKREVRK